MFYPLTVVIGSPDPFQQKEELRLEDHAKLPYHSLRFVVPIRCQLFLDLR